MSRNHVIQANTHGIQTVAVISTGYPAVSTGQLKTSTSISHMNCKNIFKYLDYYNPKPCRTLRYPIRSIPRGTRERRTFCAAPLKQSNIPLKLPGFPIQTPTSMFQPIKRAHPHKRGLGTLNRLNTRRMDASLECRGRASHTCD